MKFFNNLRIKHFYFQTFFLKGLNAKLSVESVEEDLDEMFSGNIDKTAELINRYLS
jgi:hypothetical protein